MLTQSELKTFLIMVNLFSKTRLVPFAFTGDQVIAHPFPRCQTVSMVALAGLYSWMIIYHIIHVQYAIINPIFFVGHVANGLVLAASLAIKVTFLCQENEYRQLLNALLVLNRGKRMSNCYTNIVLSLTFSNKFIFGTNNNYNLVNGILKEPLDGSTKWRNRIYTVVLSGVVMSAFLVFILQLFLWYSMFPMYTIFKKTVGEFIMFLVLSIVICLDINSNGILMNANIYFAYTTVNSMTKHAT